MTVRNKIAVIAALIYGIKGNYINAPIKYNNTLDCTSCIRGGYNYCMNMNVSDNTTIRSWTCD